MSDDETQARDRLLALEECTEPEALGLDGWSPADADAMAARLAAEDDDVVEVSSRLARRQQHESEIDAEEYAELQRVYQRHIKKSLRARRRMPGEPPASTLCTTEEDEDRNAGVSPCDAEVGADGPCSAANGPRLHYHQDVYDAHTMGAEGSTADAAADFRAPKPPVASRFVGRVRSARLRGAEEGSADDFGE